MACMRTVKPGTITRSVERFLNVQADGQPRPGGRERSWDFCFNYFQDRPEQTRDLELSCLQLGYYLASSGMLRGGAYLARKANASEYRRAVEVIQDRTPALAGLDMHSYADTDVRALLLDTYHDLAAALLPEGGDPHTLVTKVMLGVWGVIPAFDRFFVEHFRSLGDTPKERSAFRVPQERSLLLLSSFYTGHADEIDSLAGRFTTVDFDGQPTSRRYTRAKVVDMYAVQAGYAPATDGPLAKATSTD
jgi:hypothetical protein